MMFKETKWIFCHIMISHTNMRLRKIYLAPLAAVKYCQAFKLKIYGDSIEICMVICREYFSILSFNLVLSCVCPHFCSFIWCILSLLNKYPGLFSICSFVCSEPSIFFLSPSFSSLQCSIVLCLVHLCSHLRMHNIAYTFLCLSPSSFSFSILCAYFQIIFSCHLISLHSSTLK